MRRGTYLLIIFILIIGIALAVCAPDNISMVFIALMESVIFLGVVFGVLPAIQFERGLRTAMENIATATEGQNGSAWTMLEKSNDFFHQRTLDLLFADYQVKLQGQRESGQILSDIDDYINEEVLALHSWQSLITQIPGTLTGLGILGTFVGLIIGVRGIEFTTVNMALQSVQLLLSGIQVAFYTSIAGVILSLLFNIIYRITWNTTARELGLFREEFHKSVVPSVEEQSRYRERREIRQITELLECLPKNSGFSNAAGGNIGVSTTVSADNEQILMPQIQAGMRDGEFIFFVQPSFNLNTKAVIGAEALVRWKHEKLGMVTPAIFIPVLESNGYITKLDQYIWEKVCSTIYSWRQAGMRPIPFYINVTKTDILAMDIVDFFINMIDKYKISPRDVIIEIAENAYLQASTATIDTERRLQEHGFKVVLDGFNGDYLALSSVEGFSADALKLDLRRFNGSQNQGSLTAVFTQAQTLHINMSVEGIENMEQLTMLRKCGCTEGQGFYLSKPMALEQFEGLLNGEKGE